MEEELIKYDTAVLAKEIGFKEDCNCRYWVGFENEEYLQTDCISEDWNHYDDSSTTYYSAPTQGLLQKWLREKYNYHFIPEPYENGIAYRMWNPMLGGTEVGGVENTYEEALEQGLCQALKLI